jgi:hypothetical protein
MLVCLERRKKKGRKTSVLIREQLKEHATRKGYLEIRDSFARTKKESRVCWTHPGRARHANDE